MVSRDGHFNNRDALALAVGLLATVAHTRGSHAPITAIVVYMADGSELIFGAEDMAVDE